MLMTTVSNHVKGCAREIVPVQHQQYLAGQCSCRVARGARGCICFGSQLFGRGRSICSSGCGSTVPRLTFSHISNLLATALQHLLNNLLITAPPLFL